MTESKAYVVQPDSGESYWQPVPANGFVEIHLSRHRVESRTPFESGVQSVAPGCFVREHAHDRHEELILVYQGEGEAIVDGETHPMRPGTTLFLGPDRKHKFVNTGSEDMRFFWVLMPGGLGDFFSAIGRARTPGEPAPAPFPRPENVAEIERRTVFADPSEVS
ncbi:MAG: cupin domain-containing protein [Ectothiorhodospiraceae bacterium]|nr:cupin domain-containing protein [Ectothiorhodospiraceae bacterium]